jgi:hypothetical protein
MSKRPASQFYALNRLILSYKEKAVPIRFPECDFTEKCRWLDARADLKRYFDMPKIRAFFGIAI